MVSDATTSKNDAPDSARDSTRDGAQDGNSNAPAVGDKLAAEARLLLGSTSSIWNGIKSGVSDMYEHPMHAVEAFALGAATGAMSITPQGRALMYGLSAVGLTGMVAPDMAKVWNDPSQLASAQIDLGTKIGETLAYAPVAGLGGFAGARAATADWGGIMNRFEIVQSGEAPSAVALDTKSAQQLMMGNPKSLVDASKLDYQVNFKKITPEMYTEEGGMRIGSLETNTGGVKGELGKLGDWQATRLLKNGQPATETGNVITWPIPEKNVLKSYQVTPEELGANSEITASTRPGGVTMAPLYSDHSIEAWGSQLFTQPFKMPTTLSEKLAFVAGNRPTGWLPNYDFSATEGPGTVFGIISPKQFQDTYGILPKVTPIDAAPGALVGGESTVLLNHH